MEDTPWTPEDEAKLKDLSKAKHTRTPEDEAKLKDLRIRKARQNRTPWTPEDEAKLNELRSRKARHDRDETRVRTYGPKKQTAL